MLSNGSPEQCSVEERLSGLSIQGSAEEIVSKHGSTPGTLLCVTSHQLYTTCAWLGSPSRAVL